VPFSLYHATVAAYLQVLPSMAGLIDKAEAHCAEHGLPAEALTGAVLADDMWPFAKQITSVAHHSAGAIAALSGGVFGPDLTPAPVDFAALRTAIAAAIVSLEKVDPAAIDAMIGRDMCFAFGERRMDFTAEDFLLTFSLPNFHFHAAAAYAVLRNQGLKIGKMDFLGRPRLKV
jgi:uncharacterized protein